MNPLKPTSATSTISFKVLGLDAPADMLDDRQSDFLKSNQHCFDQVLTDNEWEAIDQEYADCTCQLYSTEDHATQPGIVKYSLTDVTYCIAHFVRLAFERLREERSSKKKDEVVLQPPAGEPPRLFSQDIRLSLLLYRSEGLS